MAKTKKTAEPKMEDQNVTDGGSGDSSDEDIIKVVWNFLSSMKLGIVLLLVMAFISIIGTIWVQKDPFTGREDFVGFYNAWYFRLLMGLLALNLLVCSLNRWKSITSTLKGPKVEFGENFVKNLKSGSGFKLKTEPQQAAEKIKALLKKKGYRVFSAQEEDTFKLASDKGHLGILGPYLTHLSFIIIIVAILVKFSGYSGFEGNLTGLVGQTYDLTHLSGLQGTVDPADNFNVKINDFRTEYRPDGSVKQWYSDVTVIDGNETRDFSIYVNNPLVHKGIKFYQMSYGNQFSGKHSGPSVKDQQFTVALQDYIQPPGTDITFIPMGFDDASKQIILRTYKGQEFVNEEAVPLNTAYKYEEAEVNFSGAESFTVLSVKKDPGVPVIGIGSLLLIVGTILSFILRQRRIWSVITPEKDGVAVQIGGISAKDKRGLDNDLEEITADLKK